MIIENKKSFTEKEVETLCKKHNKNIKLFQESMRGRTYKIKEGQAIFFGRDVRNFFNN